MPPWGGSPHHDPAGIRKPTAGDWYDGWERPGAAPLREGGSMPRCPLCGSSHIVVSFRPLRRGHCLGCDLTWGIDGPAVHPQDIDLRAGVDGVLEGEEDGRFTGTARRGPSW